MKTDLSRTRTLRELVRDSGYRNNYLAARLGVSEPSLSLKLRGLRPLPALELRLLAEIIRLPFEELEAAPRE